MVDIEHACHRCEKPFIIDDSAQLFYEKLEVPAPTHCPDCRRQRRLAFRNESFLKKRQCDLCEKVIISMYGEEVSFPVYCSDCWWSDRWDPLDYGAEFDFSRPFFEQFQSLMARVPKAAVLTLNNENCDYANYLAFSKSTYMSAGSYGMENCFYARKSQYCTDSIDSNVITKCELVAMSSNCEGCYQSHHLLNCKSVSFSSYVEDSSNLQNCFMCVGLRNKEYHFKNQPYSKEDYEKILVHYSQKTEEECFDEFIEFSRSLPKRATILQNCEDSEGNYLSSCKGTTDSFDCFSAEDSRYLLECSEVKDCMDMSMHDKEIQLCYELGGGGEKNYLTKFSFCACASPFTEYSFSCFYLSNGFGCDGFHSKKSFCILNRQYSEKDYNVLRGQIIEHMKKTGEYGEFFPLTLSPFAYNETAAQLFHPLTEAQALSEGLRWSPPLPSPSSSDALTCSGCNAMYRRQPQEVTLYSKIGLAVPARCSSCLLGRLMNWKNPPELNSGNCSQCKKSLKTSYSPNRFEKVLCETCYLEVVY